MGSYLSIHNDTNDEWICKISSDQSLGEVPGWVFGSLDDLTAMVNSAGAEYPAITTSEIGGSILVLASGKLGRHKEAGGLATELASIFIKKVEGDGGVHIKSKASNQWGKIALSNWQQGTAVRYYINPSNEKEVICELVNMRPIFSGAATDDSNLTHNIQWWINKWGIRQTTITIQD